MSNKIRTIEYDRIDSTNAQARRYAAENDSRAPILFVSKEQSAGRGRLGRSFYSSLKGGIYMSLLYFTDSALSDAVSVTTAAAVFTAEAIERATGKKMKIKWVNDIYNDYGKVAGILTETVSVGKGTAVIVGIGINTGKGDFPRELDGIASSTGELSDGDRADMIDYIAESLLSHAADPTNREYMSGYRERFMLDGTRVELTKAGEPVARGRVKGVTDDGGLIFLRDGETESEVIHTGEVSVRK